MPLPRPDVADLLDVAVPEGGTVLIASDLHLPPERSDVSGRSCAALVARLTELDGPLTVVLVNDIAELLGFCEATATDILRAHDDLCAALLAVSARGGQVIYTIGNHDGDLAWDVKSADAVWELMGARLCLAADLVFADGQGGTGRVKKVRVEHGHQLDPYNCFHDPRELPRHADRATTSCARSSPGSNGWAAAGWTARTRWLTPPTSLRSSRPGWCTAS